MTLDYQIRSVNPQKEDDDSNLCHLISLTASALARARKKELARFGLTPRQAQILGVIRSLQDKATLTSISRELLLEPYTVNTVLTQMKIKGLINKVRHPVHKVVIQVVLTEKGFRAYQSSLRYDSIRRILQNLEVDERALLHSSLSRILLQARQELEPDTVWSAVPSYLLI